MNMQVLRKGDIIDRDALLRKLVSIQYTRNDTALGRGSFRVRGETLEVFPAYEETAFRATLFGDEVERLQHFDPLTGELIADDLEHVAVWPATHYNVKDGSIERAVTEIARELNERCGELEAEGKLLESHRLRQRTQYDMEMLREMGFCNGIENYSRILDGRQPGARPYCLIDYFPEDFVAFLDESHQTVPQIGGMYEGDRVAQADARRLRLPPAVGARQPPAEVRRVPRRSRRRSCSSRRRPASTRRRTPARSSSRSCGRRASSTRPSRCARRATRSTTS